MKRLPGYARSARMDNDDPRRVPIGKRELAAKAFMRRRTIALYEAWGGGLPAQLGTARSYR